MSRWWHILPMAALALAVGGCSSSGCPENRSATPLAGFYASSTHEPIVVDSLQIWGVGTEGNFLVDRDERAADTYLPFRPDFESTAFAIRYCQAALDYEELQDTLRFWYTPQPWFAGADCGAMYYYRINRMTYTRHLVDSVAIVDSLITNIDTQRLQIYFRTSQ